MNKTKKIFNVGMLRFVPLLIMLISFIYFNIKYKISISDILNFTPDNYLLAGGVIILIYAIKSVTMFVALTVLYISVGIIFPTWQAVIINFLGLTVSMVLPYLIGRLSGRGLFNKLSSKYPKIDRLNDIEKSQEGRFIFVIKFIGIIPNEISSLAFGIIDINFKTYMIASIIAKIPAMLATTLLGANLNEPGSIGFVLSIVISIIILIEVLRIYNKYKGIFK